MLLLIAETVLWVAGRRKEDHRLSSSSRAETRNPAENPSSPTLAPPEKSVAVLPFADMSEKHDQELFADGMAEDILDLLGKYPQLKVIGRTSSFQFKGRNEDLRVVGEKLGVAFVLEGSVRRAGECIRVAAQLIDTRR